MGQDFLNRQNYTVHIADQSSIKDLERLKDDLYDGCSGQLSVIIDDGSHQSQETWAVEMETFGTNSEVTTICTFKI